MKAVNTFRFHEIAMHRKFTNSIAAVIQFRIYIYEDTKILELADAWQDRPDIPVIAVVNNSMQYLGIIQRNALFSTLGKAFGREVFKRYKVSEIMEKPEYIDFHSDIFAVASNLRINSDKYGNNQFIPVCSNDGILQGIFSQQDLSNYLAKITQDEIVMAAKLQERLLSEQQCRETSDYLIKGWARSAKGVGGDIFFIEPLDDDTIFFALCDISGKGVSASIVVSMLYGFFKSYRYKHQLKKFLKELNDVILNTFQMEKYLTGFFAIYNSKENKIICADMGHSHSYFIRNNQVYSIKSTKMNYPIGIESNIVPVLFAIQLQKDDSIILFSDGILEQENGEHIEYGEERFKSLINNNAHDIQHIENYLEQDIDAYRGIMPQQDDMSLLYLTVKRAKLLA